MEPKSLREIYDAAKSWVFRVRDTATLEDLLVQYPIVVGTNGRVPCTQLERFSADIMVDPSEKSFFLLSTEFEARQLSAMKSEARLNALATSYLRVVSPVTNSESVRSRQASPPPGWNDRYNADPDKYYGA